MFNDHMPEYIRASKHGVLPHRQIAIFQEGALNQFHAGWSNFADWLNDSTGSQRKLTYHQAQCPFTEHFSRRLLVFQGKGTNFSCDAHPRTSVLPNPNRRSQRGIIIRIWSGKEWVAPNGDGNTAPVLPADPALTQLPVPQQEAPAEGIPRGYVRLAVTPGALTCDKQSHIDWKHQYKNKFSRMSFPGVHHVIRRQQEHADGNTATGPSLRVELSSLGDTPGDGVVHTFKVKTTYCLQTVQWACGFPISWEKCYRSKSSSQVLTIFDRIWDDYPESKPSLIAYDDTCSLFRHIVTQDSSSLWLSTTKFIVNAWYYIGHCATDILCRFWCNPAPVHGSQPDLILVEEDANETRHHTCAFNIETAEQLNSWLNSFESQLQQISDANHDFIHILMIICRERVEKRVQNKDLRLPTAGTNWDKGTRYMARSTASIYAPLQVPPTMNFSATHTIHSEDPAFQGLLNGPRALGNTRTTHHLDSAWSG
ncbi:hypothetical protein B0H17DRAFT_1127143 [Mycena rosella]|uniref:Uncharacterized protein n=1 Tax=Mycena rosella TaxID=1033263 RepID=A0AAD7E0X8_MYCRO|nr:hypothetical protein B0H17DRAFT_1127143 [Mycena rosella]